MSALQSAQNFAGGRLSPTVRLAVEIPDGTGSSHKINLPRTRGNVSYPLSSPSPALAGTSCAGSPSLEGQDAIDGGVIQSEESCRFFSLAEILRATDNFDDALVIGIGGFGTVYKGFIDDGTTAVAIKRLKIESKQGAEEFWTEVKMLSKLRHTHLVALIGYCSDNQEMILVYEYVGQGTLASHIHKEGRKESDERILHLNWDQRIKICIAAARGLDYLHNGTEHGIIHRDVKSTNILLDEKWVAKISDFGLSKAITSHTATHVSTNVKGTFGYLDPDYFFTKRLTKKSDVYAFGVVLLEVLSGRPAVDQRLEEEQISLILWAQQCIRKGKIDQVIDPSLSGQITPQSLKYFAKLAKKCLHASPNERPTVVEVVGSLEIALALHQHKGRTQGIISKLFQSVAIVPQVMNRWWREEKDNSCKTPTSKHSIWKSYRHFSFAEIQAATNDFDECLLNGKYGRANELYKGYMDGGTLVVAVKRFQESMSPPKMNEVFAEVQVQSLSRHANIVSLIGFCEEKQELILVYEYMINGSLEYHLHKVDTTPLAWKKRLKICIDTARGLKYLHTGAELQVIHGDIVPSNILLDKKWVAKLGGFTLSKLLPTSIASEGLETIECGCSFVYLDPQHLLYEKVTTKSDVYAFGVLLLEVLCAKKPYSPWRNTGEESLVRWFKSSIVRRTIEQIIDPYLLGKIAPECLRDFVKIALRCLVKEGIRRPSMDDVVGSLQSALQLQETWEILIKTGFEIPVTDPRTYNDVSFFDSEFKIGGGSVHISELDLWST